MKIINHLLTGIDGETYAIARVLWVISTILFLVLTVYQVVTTGVFDYTDWGIALGAVLGGGGIGVKVTESTEPVVPMGKQVPQAPRPEL